MSGHSKWSTIKHKKAAQDQRRGALFTKLAREIMVAARTGGDDPDTNFRLRLAIQNAKSSNMPNENIDRAIKKGAGQDGDSGSLEEVTYEGYGPGGAAILIHALTDNKNRTVSDIRSRFAKMGGSLAENGAVSWSFDSKGALVANVNAGDPEEVALAAVDAGAEDFTITDDTIQFTTPPAGLDELRETLEGMDGVTIQSAELSMVPKAMMPLDDARSKQILRLLEALEELDDVQKVFSNADFSEVALEEYSAA